VGGHVSTTLFQVFVDSLIEDLVYSTSSGTVAITHDPLSNARMAFLNKGPGRIISLIWGTANALR
jgi:hypothetical protein